MHLRSDGPAGGRYPAPRRRKSSAADFHPVRDGVFLTGNIRHDKLLFSHLKKKVRMLYSDRKKSESENCKRKMDHVCKQRPHRSNRKRIFAVQTSGSHPDPGGIRTDEFLPSIRRIDPLCDGYAQTGGISESGTAGPQGGRENFRAGLHHAGSLGSVRTVVPENHLAGCSGL